MNEFDAALLLFSGVFTAVGVAILWIGIAYKKQHAKRCDEGSVDAR